MRFKRHIKLEKGLRQIDIAPLIDIVFQLLIFFMLTSNFIAHKAQGIEIFLPRAESAEPAPGENPLISLSREGIIYFAGKVVTLKELKARLNRKQEGGVFIRADRGCPLGRVVAVWDLCRELGIYKVNIGVEGQ